MSNEWIDISVPVANGMHHWPGEAPLIERSASIASGSVCNVTHLDLSAHTGTHMDAPLHFIDNAAAMESMPLDAVLGPCTIVEVNDPVAVRAEHLAGLDLEPRVLFKTPNSTRSWRRPSFAEDYVYIADEAAAELVKRGIRTVGIDYLSVGGYTNDLVETHLTLLGAGVWIIEGLQLAHVKPGRYELACLPLKIPGSDGAPARAVIRPL